MLDRLEVLVYVMNKNVADFVQNPKTLQTFPGLQDTMGV